MRCFVVLCAITAVLGTTYPSLHEQWAQWKERHGKVYGDEASESARRSTWQRNYELVAKHNRDADKHGFKLALNQFADQSNEEFSKKYLSSFPISWTSHHQSSSVDFDLRRGTPVSELPSRLDWRKLGYVTPVKDQGDCGSCWAFSATGALEGQHFRRKESLVSLSEQQLMDCSWPYDNYGCDGGKVDRAFDYVGNNGLCAEKDYCYFSYVWKCMDSYCTNKVNSTGYVRVQSGNETALLETLARVGPVSMAIDASGYQFQFYSEGIFSSTQCDSSHLNHAMLAVGYSSYYGDTYWIVKNSWGEKWGQEGYIQVARDEGNMCGIATAAIYPVLG